MTLFFVYNKSIFAQLFIVIVGVVGVAIVPQLAFAQDLAGSVASQAGLSALPLPVLIGRFIAVLLSLLGVILLGIILYAGFLWMTAGGNEENITKAKALMRNGVIGIVIIVLSFAITSFVVNLLSDQGIFGGGGSQNDGGGVSIEPYSGSYGYGIVEHYPGRGQMNVPRNARIFITFAEPMDPSGFLDGSGNALNASNIKIYRNVDGEEGAFKAEDVAVRFTEDMKTVALTPPTLGSPTENTQYTVFLSDDLRTEDGERIIRDRGYSWFFTVGTFFDNTPPTVQSVIPVAGKTYAKNVLTEIRFSEPVDPTSASGTSGPNSTLRLTNGEAIVSGSFYFSNNYSTVTFVPDSVCGTNSCGDVMYCLPGGATITALVKAATVGENPPLSASAEALTAFDGIVDNVGNALDGNKDGVAGDDYSWAFTTTNETQLGAPTITSVNPPIQAENIPLDAPVNIAFSTQMSSLSLSSETIDLLSNPEHSLWYNVRNSIEDEKSTAVLQHGVFLKSTIDQQYLYGTVVSNKVKDIYQNCFSPANGPGLDQPLCGTSAQQPYCCNGSAQSNACELF